MLTRKRLKDQVLRTKWWVVAANVAFCIKEQSGLVVMFVCGAVMSGITAKLFKRLLRQPRPKSSAKIDPGMPSSHATVLTYEAVSMLYYPDLSPSLRYSSAVLLCLGCVERIANGHHTVPQVVVGSCLGTIVSLVWFPLTDALGFLGVADSMMDILRVQDGWVQGLLFALVLILGFAIVSEFTRGLAGTVSS